MYRLTGVIILIFQKLKLNYQIVDVYKIWLVSKYISIIESICLNIWYDCMYLLRTYVSDTYHLSAYGHLIASYWSMFMIYIIYVYMFVLISDTLCSSYMYLLLTYVSDTSYQHLSVYYHGYLLPINCVLLKHVYDIYYICLIHSYMYMRDSIWRTEYHNKKNAHTKYLK